MKILVLGQLTKRQLGVGAADSRAIADGGVTSGDVSGPVAVLFDSGDVSCSVGTGGSASRTTVYSVPSGYRALIPLAVYMEVGGTVASGETVTISVKAVFDDGSEREIGSYSVTGGTGSSTETSPFAILLTSLRSAGASAEDRYITSIVADVSSDQSSTSATATVRVVGVKIW